MRAVVAYPQSMVQYASYPNVEVYRRSHERSQSRTFERVMGEYKVNNKGRVDGWPYFRGAAKNSGKAINYELLRTKAALELRHVTCIQPYGLLASYDCD